MVRQVFIELGCDSSDLPQVVPGRVGEVVVFEVVSEIEVEDVPKANVVVGLLAFDELVVLCDDVNGGRVRADRAQASHQQEEKRIRAPSSVDEVVGEEDEDVVQGFVPAE